MQIAETTGIPIVLCFRDFGMNCAPSIQYENPDMKRHTLQIGDGFVSVMALGIPCVKSVIKYSDSKAGVRQVCEAVSDLRGSGEAK